MTTWKRKYNDEEREMKEDIGQSWRKNEWRRSDMI